MHRPYCKLKPCKGPGAIHFRSAPWHESMLAIKKVSHVETAARAYSTAIHRFHRRRSLSLRQQLTIPITKAAHPATLATTPKARAAYSDGSGGGAPYRAVDSMG